MTADSGAEHASVGAPAVAPAHASSCIEVLLAAGSGRAKEKAASSPGCAGFAASVSAVE